MEEYKEILTHLEYLKDGLDDLREDFKEHQKSSDDFRGTVSSHETSLNYLKGWITAVTVGVCYGMWDLIFKGK